MQGWIKIHRDITDHWIWQDEKYFRWWITILIHVNHCEKKFPVDNKLHICKPGESFRSIDEWKTLFRCSKPTVIKFFKLLKTDSMINTKIIGRGNRRKHMLTVVNWDKYQQTETKILTENKPECLLEINPSVDQKCTSNKNDKNDKKNREVKDKRFSPPSLPEIQSYFSLKIAEKGINLNPKIESEKFESFYSSKNWYVGKNKMVDWKKSISGWIARSKDINGFTSKEKTLKAI